MLLTVSNAAIDPHGALEGERRRLSLLRWIELQMPASDRWRPVYHRYLGLVARRVDDLSGDSSSVTPSPYDDGSPEHARTSFSCCWSLPIIAAAAIALLSVLPLAMILPSLPRRSSSPPRCSSGRGFAAASRTALASVACSSEWRSEQLSPQ